MEMLKMVMGHTSLSETVTIGPTYLRTWLNVRPVITFCVGLRVCISSETFF